MPDRHAFLSPSSAERWFHCTPSARLCEQFPDQGSIYAAEGTEAHRLCEYLLNTSLSRPDTDPRPGMTYYNPEMQEGAEEYVQYVLERIAALGGAEKVAVFIEQRVDLRKYIPESMGTADCILVTDGAAEVIDFKYGLYRVPATSLQLRLYALGVRELLSPLYDFDRLQMTIFQPRLSAVDSAATDAAELAAWAREALAPRAEMAFRGAGEFTPGPWCRNCRARRQCRALAEQETEMLKYDFREPPLLTDAEIGEILEKAEALTAWAAAVKEYALAEAQKGKVFPGWKLAAGRAQRRFTDDAEAARRLEEAGIPPWEKKMMGIPALEKRMGKKGFDALLADLVIRPEGKPMMVRTASAGG